MEAASTVAPVESPQHMQALAHANRVRLARAALKREIKTGSATAADVVRDCPLEVETMTVSELLKSQDRWGRSRVKKFLGQFEGVSESRQLRRLSTRQRELIAHRLEEVGARRR
jgi:hypothetical protein